MKIKLLLIGLALVLMLCISPVAAVSGTDFDIDIDKSGYFKTYTYYNKNNPDEKYIHLHSDGTHWLYSVVTFRPANIPDAPVMEVYTYGPCNIYLPQSVDEWEIKYYSRSWIAVSQHPEFLKNKGVVNLKEYFGDSISKTLYLWLSTNQVISSSVNESDAIVYHIPDSDDFKTYTYNYKNNPDEKYIHIYTDGTNWLYSLVTFKPANIPDAPVMEVYTSKYSPDIYLPYSVDEWEIKYYSRPANPPGQDPKFLKNSGVVNLKEYFEKYVEGKLILELSCGQYINPETNVGFIYSIPKWSPSDTVAD